MEPIMAETTTITVRVPVEVRDKLDRLAGATKRSRSFLAAEALETYTRRELEIVEGILEGMAEIDGGHFYTQEEMEAHSRQLFEELEGERATLEKKAARL
jgi:predicted transcriptional regulator